MLRSLLLGVVLLSSTIANAGELALREQHDGGLGVLVDGKLFTEYWITLGAKPILWPIIGPSGVEMTRQYPMKYVDREKHDHPHQRSLWFTHGEVNGVDFWTENNDHGRIVHREFTRKESGDGRAVIATVNDWLGPDGKKILEDERTLTFRADRDVRTIDFDITLKATEGDVEFGDTKEGTLGIRVPTSLDVDAAKGETRPAGEGGNIVNSHGDTDADAWGKQAPWVDYYGPVDGRTVGIAIFNHPSSADYPTRWHVRGYGLFAANSFGVKDFEPDSGKNGGRKLAKGESLTLRYRFVFHNGDAESAAIPARFESYAAEK